MTSHDEADTAGDSLSDGPTGAPEKSVSEKSDRTGRNDNSHITVLLIDDSKTIRRSASHFLTEAGYSVVTAVDGFEALAKVVEYRPAVVFADIMMPRLDGYQTCALIKNSADFQKTPVIMLSSKDGLFDRARARVVGCDDHLAKPFSAQTLTATVAAHIKRKPAKS